MNLLLFISSKEKKDFGMERHYCVSIVDNHQSVWIVEERESVNMVESEQDALIVRVVRFANMDV